MRIEARALAYDIEFDERRPINEPYIRRQIETHIGERLNVLISRTKYHLKDGIIYSEGLNEPFINILRRGRDYRRQHGNKMDRQRENAEVIGFSKVQNVLGHPETPIGSMVLSISPPGEEQSVYQHNFYDVFTLRQEGDKRYIEARRYSSSLSREEYQRVFEELTGQKFERPPLDAFFLSHPMTLNAPSLSTPDRIHEYLHREHDYMSEEDFKRIIGICTPFILFYIRTLSTNDKQLYALAFNAILNRADKAREDLKGIKDGKLIYLDRITTFSIDSWGRMPVRQVMTGCGASGGFSVSKSITYSPFSVSEFASLNQEWFTCPKCHYQADGPVGDTCPGCGLTKDEYAKESGRPVCE